MDLQTNIILNKNEILKTVLNNIILLFKRRNLLENDFNVSEKMLKEYYEDKVLYFKSNNNNLSFIYLDTDIKNITTGTMIDDYINKNNEYKKFILCKTFNKKVYKQIEEIYKNSEIFLIHEFLEDIPSKHFIPEHKILTSEEKDDLQKNIKLNELSKMFKTDTMARYYGANKNDVFRIKRYNLNSGISVVYRIVTENNYDILF
jgi:DNA-directed RNA polymerase subunit H (RpoH/RPB5)